MQTLRGIFSGGGTGRDPGSNAWERWTWAWDTIFYLLLALALALSLAERGLYGRSQLAMVAVSVLLGAWYWFMVVRHPEWIQVARPMLVYTAGALALYLVLIWLSPTFYVLNFAVYAQIFSLLPMRWAVPVSVVWTGLLVLRGIAGAPGETPAWLVSGAITLAVGLFFSFWIDSIINQSEDRRRLIAELEQTRESLAAAERAAGTLEERQRLSREIHDTLAQGFTSVVAHLEAAEGALAPDDGPALWHLNQARRIARDNLVEARHLVAALRPEILEGSSLTEALERLAARFSEETGVPAALTVTGEPRPLAQETQVALLRATQEALSNVRKHARASKVTVTLSFMDDVVALDVQDDGSGFDPDGVEAGAERGFGLKAMRERIEALDGALLVESNAGEGSTLVVELPTGEQVRAEKGRR